MARRPSLSEQARKSAPGELSRATSAIGGGTDRTSRARPNEITPMVRSGTSNIARSTATLWAEEGRRGAGRSK